MKYVAWVVGVLVVVAAAYYFFMASSTSPEVEGDTQSTAGGSAVARTGQGTFLDLASMSGDYECTISMEQDGATSAGTVYISNGEVRGEFSSTVSGQTVSSSMLQTGGYVYTWSDMTPQGFKMVLTGNASATAAPSQGAFNPSAGVDYDCDPWTRDSAKFVVPANITFMEPPMVQ